VGATVYLQSTNAIDARLGTTTTNDEGRYEFRDARLPVHAVEDGPMQGAFQVFGTAPGKGFTWHGMRSFIVGRREDSQPMAKEDYRIFAGEPVEMDLTFRPPARLQGRVVDQSGAPVVDAAISLKNADWLDTRDKEEHQNFREFWCITDAPPETRTARTGPDGRFEIPELPAEAGFWVFVEHPDYATRTLHYATTNRPTSQFDYPHISYLPARPKVETGELTVRFVATRRLAVHVVRADDGGAAPGVKVHLGQGADGTSAYGVTDAQGLVRLKLPPGEYPALLDPERGGVYIRTSSRIRVEDQPGEQTIEFRVDVGCVLILEVVDADTGKGVSGVDFLQDDSPAGDRTSSVLQASTSYVEHAKTDEAGRLRAVLKPGRTRVSINHIPEDSGYERPAEDQGVELSSGETVRIRFEVRKRPPRR
jgi:hypothetical protein